MSHGRSAGTALELLLPGADVSDRERWLAARRAGVTASEIGIIMGHHKSWQSPYSLYCEKLGLTGEQPDNTAMSFGRFAEPFVLQQFETRFPEYSLVQVGLCCHAERMWQMATCDRVAITADPASSPMLSDPVPVEAKTSNTFEGWGPDGSAIIPPGYWCQVQWQMDVLDAPYGYVTCFFQAANQIRTYQIWRDDADLAAMRAAARAFLFRVERCDPPPVDESPATLRALKALHSAVDADGTVELAPGLIRMYRAAIRRYGEAEARKRELDNLVRAAMGTARKGIDPRTGETIVTRSVYLQRSYTRKEGTVDRLNPVKPKRDKEPEI